MCDVRVGRVRQDGSVEGSWAATSKLRRVQGGVLIGFLGFQQQAMFPGSMRGWPQEAVAVLAGVCFCALLAVAWALMMRCGDEHRRAFLQRSMLIGVAITMALSCVAGFVEVAMGDGFHVPLLAVPACLVVATAMAKTVIFHRRWLGLGPRAR